MHIHFCLYTCMYIHFYLYTCTYIHVEPTGNERLFPLCSSYSFGGKKWANQDMWNVFLSQLSQGAFLPSPFLLITPREGKAALLSPHFLHQCLVLPFPGSGLLFSQGLFEVVPVPDLSAAPLRCSPGFCCPLVYLTAPWDSSTFLFTPLQLVSGLVSISGFRFCVSPSCFCSFASPPCFYLYLCLVPLCSVVSQSSKSSTSLVWCSPPVFPIARLIRWSVLSGLPFPSTSRAWLV